MTIVLFTTGAAMLSYFLVIAGKRQLAAEKASARRHTSKRR